MRLDIKIKKEEGNNMNKTMKILSIALLVIMIVATATSVFAAESVLTQLNTDIKTANVDTSDISKTAGTVISMIRNIAIIASVIIIVILGFKYMMGSVEEKAGYQKSFIPLIVGIVVVLGATSIASFLFNMF